MELPVYDLKDSSSLFWDDLRELVQIASPDAKKFKRKVRDLLVRFCDLALVDCKENYGDFYFQLNFFCEKFKIIGSDKYRLLSIRYHTSNKNGTTIPILMSDLRVIALLYCKVFSTQLPADIDELLPVLEKDVHRRKVVTTELPKSCRCIVVNSKDGVYEVDLDIEGHDTPYPLGLEERHFAYLKKMLTKGVQLNLLEATIISRKIVPKFVVFEPDFVLDISSIANCFAEYGQHPLAFIVNKMRRRPLSQPILLGNFAGSALDDIIHSNEETGYKVSDSINNNFKEKAIDFCTCPGFDANEFVKSANNQVSNLQQAVEVLFSDRNKDLAVLEPTFICEALGIQGRVDLMTIDFKLLVEQKSGKNSFIEWKSEKHGSKMMSDCHYAQLLMYLGIMMYNFKIHHSEISAKLLYSRYMPKVGIVNAGFGRESFLDVLRLRNQIVATEFDIARKGFQKYLPYITPNVLNEKNLNNDFYNRYLLPQIMEVTSPLQGLSALEREYFCRMATFSYLELMISKVGKKEGASSCFADLWNLPLDKKIEAGNIYLGLKVKKKEKSSSFNGYDMITLSVPYQGDNFLPNFRNGDMVYLYSYPERKDPDIRRSLLFSGFLAKISNEELVVRLGDGQKNPNLIDYFSSCFALEHADSDASANSQMRGLLEFVTAPSFRKQLLLSQRNPERDENLSLSRSYDLKLDDLLLKIKQAKDFFLLIGPPGTGKTHRAMRFIVQEELSKPDSCILLLSYTNRAVDEICSMLVEDLGVDFLRLGRASSCDKKYRNFLIGAVLDKETPKLDVLKATLSKTRIVVSTVSYMMSKPSIFMLKHFSLALIDEASQILEPDLIGLLGSHVKDKDNCDIDKFIMVGDYKQLPAVVLQTPDESAIKSEQLNDAGFFNCRMSLFQRLIYRERELGRDLYIGILNKQGRMHPEIAEFTNSMFYASEHLEIVPCQHQLEKRLSFENDVPSDFFTDLLRTKRLLFFPSKKDETQNLSEKVNVFEANLVADLLVSLVNLYGDHFDSTTSVGIIVPYRNQIALIKREIEKRKHLLPEYSNWEDISIDTVERYQGSQRDVIIYSFTVQHIHQLEFLTSNNFVESFYDGGRVIDPKLNVVMTRARKQLIMTGNADVLSNNSIFKSMIDYMKTKGAYIESILSCSRAVQTFFTY